MRIKGWATLIIGSSTHFGVDIAHKIPYPTLRTGLLLFLFFGQTNPDCVSLKLSQRHKRLNNNNHGRPPDGQGR